QFNTPFCCVVAPCSIRDPIFCQTITTFTKHASTHKLCPVRNHLVSCTVQIASLRYCLLVVTSKVSHDGVWDATTRGIWRQRQPRWKSGDCFRCDQRVQLVILWNKMEQLRYETLTFF